MTEKQKEQLEKFKKFIKWIYDDCSGALEKANAKFLVAMGLFNYIETMGGFLIGKSNCQGECTKRFNAFFQYMGQGYGEILRNNPDVYSELRCGMSHEFLPKSRKFCIADKYAVRFSEGFYATDIESSVTFSYISEQDFYDQNRCGIIFNNETWTIVPKELLVDFQESVDRLVREVEGENNSKLTQIFFETAQKTNLDKLVI